MTDPTAQPAHNPIAINPETCIGCMICDFVCPGDVIIQQPRTKQLPVIAHPDECWYCGLCEQACPADAITIVFPEEMLAPTTTVQTLLGRDPE